MRNPVRRRPVGTLRVSIVTYLAKRPSFLMVLSCRGHYRCSVGRCTTLGYLCMWVFRRCEGRRIMGQWIVWSASMGRTRVVDSRSRRSSASARADAAASGRSSGHAWRHGGSAVPDAAGTKPVSGTVGLWMFRGKSVNTISHSRTTKGTRAPLFLDPFPIT